MAMWQWESDGNYGRIFRFPDGCARVQPSHKSGYMCSLHLNGQATVSAQGFTSYEAALGWCDQYLHYIIENQQLRAKTELHAGWLRYYAEEYSKVRALLNEREWAAIREQWNAAIPFPGESEAF